MSGSPKASTGHDEQTRSLGGCMLRQFLPCQEFCSACCSPRLGSTSNVCHRQQGRGGWVECHALIPGPHLTRATGAGDPQIPKPGPRSEDSIQQGKSCIRASTREGGFREKWPQADILLNETEATSGGCTCRQGWDLCGQLEAGLTITALVRGAGNSSDPLDGRMVTILFRAKAANKMRQN